MAVPGSPSWLRSQLAEKEKLSDRRIEKLAGYSKHIEMVALELVENFDPGYGNALRVLAFLKRPSSIPTLYSLYVHTDPMYMVYTDLLETLAAYGQPVVDFILSRETDAEHIIAMAEVINRSGTHDPRALDWMKQHFAACPYKELLASYMAEFGDLSVVPIITAALDEVVLDEENPDWNEQQKVIEYCASLKILNVPLTVGQQIKRQRAIQLRRELGPGLPEALNLP